MLEKLYFEEGEFAKWQKHIEIKCTNDEVKYTYGGFKFGNVFQTTKKGSVQDFQQFLEKVNQIKLDNWKNEYFAPVLDGHSWTLEYKDSSHPEKTVRGINAYPENYRDLVKLVYSVLQ